MSNIQIICKTPIIIKDDNFLYKVIANQINDSVDIIKPVPFEFKSKEGRTAVERYRYIYPIQEIINNTNLRELFKKFSIEILPSFLTALKGEILCDEYSLNDPESLRYCLRIRVFEDKQGYSLQPHQDSSDTIFSFILQLQKKNPKTSVYRSSIQRNFLLSNKNLTQAERDEQFISIVRDLLPLCDLKKSYSQFSENIGVWANGKYFHYVSNHDEMTILELDEKLVEVGEFELYGIHNSHPGIFKFPSSRMNMGSYHGVHPIDVPSRRLLIMDLIARPVNNSSDMLLLKGVNNDVNSHYMIFKSETCMAFNNLLI